MKYFLLSVLLFSGADVFAQNAVAKASTLYDHTSAHMAACIWGGFLLVGGVGLLLFFTTPLCRDLSYDPETNLPRPLKQRSFSYAKTQLFWWTVIILSCFLGVYIYTNVLVDITDQMVILLGGGLMVGLTGTMIDRSQMQANNQDMPSRHQDITASQGFLLDILSDESGVSIHRFQAVVINLIFGVAFVVGFVANLKGKVDPFIKFDPNQMALLGVSAAAYLGFKTSENGKETKIDRQVAAVQEVNRKKEEENLAAPARQTVMFQAVETRLKSKGMV
ncbi:hypothetical protein [Chitinophaga sancti]|uniref:Uncharacterized protein n=1 Tax=Chitinophaga sancti TaxID=1004 RepID=A0A1K1M6D6_9BACT|nr:hypothetical protein [Chitinophaga sancti]WQD64601.1 hypothetical protein U0033_09355 [Chitinophaga sancti]WQG89775.1 hypothetical protein SR876_33120 [Chitinophaga sancti]SFW18633.1 hypothetical protein SAMN05661012_00482 [Chitinophaga sancti]